MRIRKRGLGSALLAAALAVAALPTPAGAFFELDFNGHVRQDPDSYVGFELKRTSAGKHRVNFFTTGGIVYTCDDDSTGRTGFLTLDGSLRVKHRRFKGEVHVLTPSGDPVARVHGKLHRDHRVANGTIHLIGKLSSTEPSRHCDTGVLEWRATRGQQG